MKNPIESSAGERKEIKKGEIVFLTDKGVRSLLVGGHTHKDFDITDPLKVEEVRNLGDGQVAYMVTMPRSEALVAFGRDEIDFSGEE